MKVHLIRPKTDELYAPVKQVYSSFPPPVGLSCIGSEIRDCAEVSIYDGNIIEPTLEADIIGLQDWVTTHKEALALAKRAKQQNPNCITVLGGINASHLAPRILMNHSFVDYVVSGHGEPAMAGLVEGRLLDEIPNLNYREGGLVKRTKQKLVKSPFFDLEQVVEWECDEETPFPISAIRGCIKSAREGICKYCSLFNERVNIISPEDFWTQIRILKDRYSLTYFFETGDEFNVGTYPQRLLDARPEDLRDIRLRIYAYPEILAQKGVIDTLARLQVRELYMGVETVNQGLLTNAGRQYNANAVEGILEQMNAVGIRAMMPFMFGLPGETNDTAQENFDFSQRLLERYPETIKMMQYSLVVPIIGSEYFVMASTAKKVREAYEQDGKSLSRDDDFDYQKLTELFIETFTEADIEFLKGLVIRGKKITKEKGYLTSTFIGVGE